MVKTILAILKVLILRHRCANSVRNVKMSIKTHVRQVESVAGYFKKVAKSHNDIVTTLDSSSKILETSEKDLLKIYDDDWNSSVKNKLSEHILMIRDNIKYMADLKKEMNLATQTAKKV